MTKDKVGIEIDGETVTLVEVRDGYAQFVRVLSSDNLNNSLKLALSGYKFNKNDSLLRVVLSSQGINFRSIDITASMLDRINFEEAVFEAMPVPKDSNSTSGIFFSPEDMIGTNVTKGIAMITPSSQIENVYKSLGKVKSEVVSPPAVFTGLDGVWLSIRNQTADVTLVSEGRPVAYRQLRTGGLDVLANKVGDTLTGREKVYYALNRNAKVDPVLENEIRLYNQNLATELRQTVDYWGRTNIISSQKINVIGIGANLLGMQEAIFDQNFTIELNDVVSKRITQIPVEDRARAVTAFLAAMTAGEDMPYVSYVNPFALSLANEKKRRDKRARQYILGMLAIGAVALVTILPYIFEKSKLNELESNLKSSQNSFNSLGDMFAIHNNINRKSEFYKNIKCTQPDWKESLAIVFSAAKELVDTRNKNLIINEVKVGLSDSNLKITYTSELVNGNSDDLTIMLKFLRGLEGVESAWSDSFTFRDGKASYNISFTFKNNSDNVSNVSINNLSDPLCSETGEIK